MTVQPNAEDPGFLNTSRALLNPCRKRCRSCRSSAVTESTRGAGSDDRGSVSHPSVYATAIAGEKKGKWRALSIEHKNSIKMKRLLILQ